MARAAALTTVGVLGFATYVYATPFSLADPPANGQTATVYQTVTETRTVSRRIEGRGIGWWRHRAVVNRKEANGVHATLLSLRRHQRAIWTPTVSYAISLASRVFGVSESKMRAVAYCESTLDPFASNGRYHGLFQLGWSPFGLSAFDPIANALSAAQTVARDGSWRQWTCG